MKSHAVIATLGHCSAVRVPPNRAAWASAMAGRSEFLAGRSEHRCGCALRLLDVRENDAHAAGCEAEDLGDER
jgi:hypothetical protein